MNSDELKERFQNILKEMADIIVRGTNIKYNDYMAQSIEKMNDNKKPPVPPIIS